MSASARSSVLINLDQLCKPVAIRLQEIPTSGKHAGAHALSSMRCQRLKGLSETRKTSRQISLSGSQIQPKVLCSAHTFSSLIPCSAADISAAIFLR
jgi:hypothetical protein